MAELRNCLIFLTRSTTPVALAEFRFQTSSQAYEVNLLHALAECVDVHVVHIGGKHVPVRSSAGEPLEIRLAGGVVQFHEFGPIRLSTVRAFRRLMSRLAAGCTAAVIANGYHPNEIATVATIRTRHLRAYSIVFDTHLQGNSRMPWPKRWLANAYFALGFRMLRWLDGILVVNDAFIAAMKLPLSFHKTRIGNLYRGDPPVFAGRRSTHAHWRLFFAGTLNAENGVGLLLDFMAGNKDAGLELTFHGYGEMRDEIERRSIADSRIRFGGVLDDVELDVMIPQYDFLVCLRDPQSVVGQFAFPSKLIKFMGSGVPVICNVFPGLEVEYQEHLLLMRDYSVASLGAILQSGRERLDLQALGEGARRYIAESHAWGEISTRMVKYLFTERNEQHGRDTLTT